MHHSSCEICLDFHVINSPLCIQIQLWHVRLPHPLYLSNEIKLLMILFLEHGFFSPQTHPPSISTSTSCNQLSKLSPHLHSWHPWVHICYVFRSHLSRAQMMKTKLLIMPFKVFYNLDLEFLSSVFSFINYCEIYTCIFSNTQDISVLERNAFVC